jgi:hypothetical protein
LASGRRQEESDFQLKKARMEIQVNGTFVLKQKGRFFKVLSVRHEGSNSFTFECKDLDTRQRQVLQCQLLGLSEALDSAAPFMKSPRDILLMDLNDNEGRWKVIPEAKINGLFKEYVLRALLVLRVLNGLRVFSAQHKLMNPDD